MNALIALVAGLLFGAGLLLSGMANPANVLGFLDVAGAWNPVLAFVMGGAIAVALPAFWWARRHPRALNGRAIELPTRASLTAVTPRLVAGSAVFGLGWGLVGLCPGPSLVLLGLGVYGEGGWREAATFVLAMAGGLVVGLRFGSGSSGAGPVERGAGLG